MQTEQQFFRSLFENAPIPYQALDSEGRILAVNNAWQQEMGFEKHEVLGRWFGDFMVSGEREAFRERFRQFLEHGFVQGAIWQMQRRDGSLVRISLSGRAIRDENGRFLRTQCMFFDLSKRSEAEKKLREVEEFRTAFMESTAEGFGLFDANLKLVYINGGGARMFGATPDELVGRTMGDISPETAETDRYSRLRQVLETGEGFSIDEYAPPAALGERLFALQAFKVGDYLGIVLRDVTETRLSERLLQESEARWRSMAEGSADHVVILDEALKIEYVNRPSPGLTIDELIGAPLYEYVDVSQRDRVRLVLQTVLETGEPSTYETEFTDPEGKVIHYESRVAPRIASGKIEGLTVYAKDVTDQKDAADRIERLLKRETAMAALAIDFSQHADLADVYRTAYRQVRALLDADVFIISRLDPTRSRIVASYIVRDGDEQNALNVPSIRLGGSDGDPQLQVIRTGSPLLVADMRQAVSKVKTPNQLPLNDRELRPFDAYEDTTTLPSSALFVPMRIRNEVVGVMQVQSYAKNAYRPEDADLLAGLSTITAVTMENRQLIGQLQESYEGIIRALAKAIELRDPYTKQHQEGVAHLAIRIGKTLGLPEEQIRGIELAANIHDIGKVIIPAEILSKPSQLSPAQMSIVQSHVFSAHEVLEDIAFPWDIDDIVLQHHERMDGSGYPNGLQGDQIRMEARILGVADIADAMLSHRPYRPAHSLEVTTEELLRLRGNALDPVVVDACLHVLKSNAVSANEADA